ncbi:MAG: MalY/PatB family protein [Brevibacterium aurantiacum]|uniref:cysteine-S-conjugate beta-lyase n=2 Tax=Brevibacterium TaxID=1696 RepID=A0A1D7W1X8_BREAU|nr:MULTISPECIES: aminotransferase class I/II-fold pyridoxal phosphate-dependent enzyme [Brevibacterium]AOP52962.1 Cystathionine beta-lyase, type II [Brevibacterium aurantiacum]AZL05225.1 aminotransferase class I/II [Brevibacterium aurantiacum]AZL12415.1 aminotransferase class I/II [Brevibacterium aurantiacum]AZT96677.1 aminotransferase class I/II [Brevibacterium aurantiacum]MDN5550222.1 aminotransferase class I/II-fold pyridoxal phosphate-dependent enzyme [Brevibacterium sp.]
MQNLDSITEESLIAKGGRKWSSFPGSLGAFIAEMDFGVAPGVRQALREVDERDLYGYAPQSIVSDLKSATSAFCAERYGWQFPTDHVELASDVIASFLGILTHLTPADTPIVLPTPAYMPFFDVAKVTGRELFEVPMIRSETGWSVDLDALDSALVPGATLVLCNPHNPIGKVYTEAELLALAEVVERNGARVFSDEIHAPLVYAPARHISYASLNETTAGHTATATAASKAFNIPGLKCAQLILSSEKDREIWAEKGNFVSGAASNPGILATTAAYTQSGDWLDEITAYLKGNRELLTDLVSAHLPNATFLPPEGTYLAWLDLRGYGLETGLSQHFNERAHVAITEGRLCGEVGEGHIRFNFALPRPLLTGAIERIASAL